jgi:hypothetical protein
LFDRLNTDRSIQPLVAQFVPLKVETEGEPWNKWCSKYRFEGQATPIIWIVRSDGQQMFGKAGGIPENELPRFMMQQLTQAGKMFSEQQLAQVSEAVDAIKKAEEGGDVAVAVRRASGLQKLGTPGALGSYAKIALEADGLIKKLTDRAKSELTEAKKRFSATDTRLEGAVAMLAIKRAYGNMPALKLELNTAIRDAGADPAARDVIEQAKLLEQANYYLKMPDGQTRAANSFRQVASRYPNTPAAKIADEQLKKLPAAGEAPARVASSPAAAAVESSDGPKGAEDGAAAKKKASSYLRMAKVFAAGRPEKARQYAQNVIDLAPDSAEAQEAKQLLDELK